MAAKVSTHDEYKFMRIMMKGGLGKLLSLLCYEVHSISQQIRLLIE